MDRIHYSLSDERLEGDNQYHCQSCGKKRDATRSAAITSLPPILHFSLLRFVFDPKTYDRRKSRASITFPRRLDLGGHAYNLQAIITHSGPSAHEGHFVCEAQEQETGSWFMCDDEDVSQIKRSVTIQNDGGRQPSASGSGSGLGSEPPTKRAKTDDDTLRSKDAYMLVYTRLGNVDPIQPPLDIMAKIDLQLAEWYNDQGQQEVEKYVLEDEYQGLVGAKKQIARLLPGMDCLVPTAELERWYKAEKLDELFIPWTIPVCPHGAVDPDSTGLFKMISLDAFELLHRYGSDIPHGYSEAGEPNRKGKRPADEVIDLSESPPPIAEELPGIETAMNGLSSDHQASTYSISSQGQRLLVNGSSNSTGPEGSGARQIDGVFETKAADTRRTSSTKSPSNHNDVNTPSRNGSSNAFASSSKLSKPSTDMSRTPSSQCGIKTYSTLPRMTICPDCVEAEYHSRSAPGLSKEDREFWKAEIKLDRQIMKSLDPKFVMFDHEYYYLPDNFVEPWEEFVKYDYACRPKLSSDLGRCQHGLLAVDLEMDEIHFIDKKGWDQVVQK